MFDEITIPQFKDSLFRRSTALKNKIISSLKKLGVDVDGIEFSRNNPMKTGTEHVSWYLDDRHCFVSCAKFGRTIENLYAISVVVTKKVEELINEEITFEEFIQLFTNHDTEVLDDRQKAREFFGVTDPVDMAVVNKQYKTLAKTLHPDTDSGDHDSFQELNKWHKVLKKEFS
ncbi:J domain-containing protein [Candidatus Woesearchaeota archaeon]|nr:J domain-containing protein [Candidatus Woesearchaeota archaeon]